MGIELAIAHVMAGGVKTQIIADCVMYLLCLPNTEQPQVDEAWNALKASIDEEERAQMQLMEHCTPANMVMAAEKALVCQTSREKLRNAVAQTYQLVFKVPPP